MRSLPQRGVSRALVASSARTAVASRGRPGCPADFQRQNRLQPRRCQRMTVSGRTKNRCWRHSRRTRWASAQKSRSSDRNRGRARLRGQIPRAATGGRASRRHHAAQVLLLPDNITHRHNHATVAVPPPGATEAKATRNSAPVSATSGAGTRGARPAAPGIRTGAARHRVAAHAGCARARTPGAVPGAAAVACGRVADSDVPPDRSHRAMPAGKRRRRWAAFWRPRRSTYLRHRQTGFVLHAAKEGEPPSTTTIVARGRFRAGSGARSPPPPSVGESDGSRRLRSSSGALPPRSRVPTPAAGPARPQDRADRPARIRGL